LSKFDRKEIIVGGIIGIAGIVIGSVTTSLATLYSDKEKLRLTSALESYQANYGQYPIEFQHLKMLIDEMKAVATMKSETIRQLADVVREYPGCGNKLSESCRPSHVKTISIMRQEMGSGYVSPEDIDIVIGSKYEQAQKSLEKLNQ